MGRKPKVQVAKELQTLKVAKELQTLKQQQKQASHFFKPVTVSVPVTVSETTRALTLVSPNVNRTISIKSSPIKNATAKRRLVVVESDSSEDEAITSFEQEFAASCSSSAASKPVAKKVKGNLPHTREHLGHTYYLSDYGLKNYEKLLDNNQLDRHKQLFVTSSPCSVCEGQMDWQVDGPLRQKDKGNGIIYYRGSHNGACLKIGQNDPAMAYDKELKQIDSKLAVLNSKKVKSEAESKQIATLTARRDICFQKGMNSKSKKAADDAREAGMCPGVFDHGCPSKSPQVAGRSYCAPCQIKSTAWNAKPESHASVVRAREKRVERDQGIEVLVPIVTSLITVDIRALLPAETVEKLRDLTQFVGCDSENYKIGGYTAEHTHEWVFRNFETGTTLHLKRYYNQWNMTLDSTPKKLISDAKAKQVVFNFIGQKTLVYSAWSQVCDKKRLMDWYGYKDLARNYSDKALSFKWFNLGFEVCYKIFGPEAHIVTPTMRLLTLYTHLYDVPGKHEVSVPTPPGHLQCGAVPDKCMDDVVQMFDIALALSLSILDKDSE